MKEDFFNVGYTTYLQKKKIKGDNWTNYLIRVICRHKFIFLASLIVIMCLCMNLFLIYKFMKIIEISLNY